MGTYRTLYGYKYRMLDILPYLYPLCPLNWRGDSRGLSPRNGPPKATHYFELAAMKGNVAARHNLGCIEQWAGNMNKALKHSMIAVKDGSADSLYNIKRMYKDGHGTKDDYTKALGAYQAYLNEVKSDQRDKAAAADDEFKYY